MQGLAPCGPGVLPAGMLKEPAPYGPGPWGGDGGKPWDDVVFSGVKKIFLTRGEAIYSIQFEYDCNGQSMWSVKHGANKEGTCHVVLYIFHYLLVLTYILVFSVLCKLQHRNAVCNFFFFMKKKTGPIRVPT